MAKTGYQSSAELSVISNVVDINRLPPPVYFENKHKSTWLSIVNNKPADWFGSEHIAMLESLCRHIVMAQELSIMIDAIIISSDLEDEGLKRLEKLQKMHRVQTQAIDNLMRSMRLSHQSIYRADKAPKVNGKTKKPLWIKE